MDFGTWRWSAAVTNTCGSGFGIGQWAEAGKI